MNVVLAKSAGACYGVQRALDLALAAAGEDGAVCTLGPLIHNPGVVADLAARGVRAAASLEDACGDVVIIRSHGVTPDVMEAALASGLRVVDATCPHVARAQKAAAELAREGCHVVVVGEAGHPEVEGLVAYASREGGRVDIVSCLDDVPADLQEPVGVVVQTTQRRENLDAIVERLGQLAGDVRVKPTICSATRKRQDAAADLASQADAMVVIGGKNSSNTTRLAEICARSCPCTHHVESAAEVDPSWFEACETVGVTAGASTPENQIRDVAELLESLG